MDGMNTEIARTDNFLNKTPKALELEILMLMASGNIKLPAKGKKFLFYMYLAVFGSCTREAVPLLLEKADRAVRKISPLSENGCHGTIVSSKTVDDFISNRLRKGSIIKSVIRKRILYSLSPAGYYELSGFLSSQYITPYIGSRNAGWYLEDTHNAVKNRSVHSSTVGIVFMHMADKCRIGAGDFSLNTPIGSNGSIRRESFDQSSNRFRSDAHLITASPCQLEFFFENDMGTERVSAVGDKMERYFSLIFSAERDLDRTCVHFTIGDYHKRGVKKNLRIPSRNRMQVYKSCVSVLLSAVGVSGGAYPPDAGKAIGMLSSINDAQGMAGNGILSEIVEYLSEAREICPDFIDIYSYFDRTQILKIAGCGDDDLPGHNTARNYHARREKIFKWCRNAPNISMLVKRGIRITSSDNCADGMDFVYSYPSFSTGGIMAYERTVLEHIRSFSYRGKYTDINDNGAGSCIPYMDNGSQYGNIRFFPAGKLFYPFANCRVMHDKKGSFIYSFENVSDDISARMRVEGYFNGGAPCIPFLQIYIVYLEDPYSLKYVDYLKSKYGFLINGREDISFLRL